MQIFIADVTDDFRLSKKRLIKKLEEMNAQVHHRLPPPFKMDLHDSAYNTTIAQCEVSVHILSQYPGRTFEDPENVFILLHQANAALKFKNEKIFWIPKNLEFENVDELEYRNFLSSLDFGFSEDPFILLKGDPQTLDEDIVKAIPFKTNQTTRQGTLIVHHAKDEDAAIKVREEARQRGIFTQYSSSGDESPSSNLKVLTDQLKDVKNVIIVVGSVNYEWANERAKHILSTIIQKEYELEWIGFYFTDNAQTFQFNARFLPLRLLDETAGMADNTQWDKFFQA